MSQQPGRGTTFVYRCRNDNRNTLWQSSMCSYRFVCLCTEARKTPNGYSWRRSKVKEWSISHSHCWCMNDTLLLCVFPRIYKNGSSRISPFFETLDGHKIFTFVKSKNIVCTCIYRIRVITMRVFYFSLWLFGAHFIQKTAQKVDFWLKNAHSIQKIAPKTDFWQGAQSIQDA